MCVCWEKLFDLQIENRAKILQPQYPTNKFRSRKINSNKQANHETPDFYVVSPKLEIHPRERNRYEIFYKNSSLASN